jgi:transketolase
VRKTGCVVTCEEHNMHGGLGDAIAHVLSLHYPVPQEYVAVRDTFGESGTPDQLMKKYGLESVNVFEAVEKVIKRRGDIGTKRSKEFQKQ